MGLAKTNSELAQLKEETRLINLYRDPKTSFKNALQRPWSKLRMAPRQGVFFLETSEAAPCGRRVVLADLLCAGEPRNSERS